jgi:hypothetical protein
MIITLDTLIGVAFLICTGHHPLSSVARPPRPGWEAR